MKISTSSLDKYWSDIVSKFDELTTVLDKAREEMRQKGGEALRDHLYEFFTEFPQVQAVGWNQYTPYFNDGDECIFGVGDICVKLDDGFEEEDEDAWGLPTGFKSNYNLYDYVEDTTQPKVERSKYDYRSGTTKVWEYPTVKRFEGTNEQLYNTLTKMGTDFHNNKEILKLAFGDHVTVIVNRDGTSETETLEHD